MSLPDDLERKILSKLPSLKSSARLSCVCKSWYRWIKHHEFFSAHPYMVIYKPVSAYYSSYSSHKDREYKILTHDPDITCPFKLPQGLGLEVVGECNGILLLQNNPYTHSDRFPNVNDSDFIFEYLCNPITREYRKLPSPGLRSSFSTHRLVYSFGFSKCDNDYKVIRFILKREREERSTEREKRSSVAEMYKLSTSSWSTFDADLGFLGDGPYHFSNSYVYVNGSCYWLYKYGSLEEAKSIVTFDLQTETLGLMKDLTDLMPPNTSGYSYDPHLGVLDDSLAICVIKRHDNTRVTEVWVMSEYTNMDSYNWTKKLTIMTGGISCSWIQDMHLYWLDSDDGKITPFLIKKEGEAQNTSAVMFKADSSRRSVVFKPTLVSLRNGLFL